MTFQIGDKVVYPNQGVGTIENISTRTFGSDFKKFYLLRLGCNRMTVLVPFSNVADIGHVGKRHQHRHAVASQAQKVELLEVRTEGSGADVFDGPNTLIGINHLIADLKSHTGSPRNHRFKVLS